MEPFVMGLLIVAVAAAMFFAASHFSARRNLQEKKLQVETLNLELRTTLEAKARAEQEANRIPQLEKELAQLSWPPRRGRSPSSPEFKLCF